MVLPDLISVFIAPLEELAIPYMVTGGVASVIYGDPRLTRDIDIVLALSVGKAERFSESFDPRAFYVPPLETLRREASRPRNGHFNVIHRDSGLRADVYLLSDDRLHEWGFERRRRLPLETITLSLAPPEYVILRKLEYYEKSGSDRHLRDIAMILRLSADELDLREIEQLADELGLADRWAEALEYNPDG